jgi:IclR family acetate operon transcriptional repressor
MAQRSVLLSEGSCVRARSKKNYEVSSVRKALQILCSFSVQQPHMSLSQLSRLLHMPKSTTHNLLRTLEQSEFVRQDGQDKLYRLGSRVCELAALFSHSTDVIANILPHLRRLAGQTGETAKLGLLSGGRVLVVAAVESSYQLHTRGDVGSYWPLHSTGLGKAILASLSPLEVSMVIGRHGLAQLTDRTIISRRELKRCLGEIRNQGYALDCEENEHGVLCIAVPLPVHAGGAPASISISGPSIRLSPQKLRDWAPLLANTAGMIAAELPPSTSGAKVRISAHKTRAPVV